MRYIWLPGAARYYDTERKRFAPGNQVRSWMWRAISNQHDRFDALSGAVNENLLSVRDWERMMRQSIKHAYIEQYLLGRGGLSKMTAEDWGSIGGMIADQYRYLDNFAVEVASGTVSPARLAARAKMYANSAQEAYWRATVRATGMPPLPAYPGDGSTICLTSCKCYWQIKQIKRKNKTIGWRCKWVLRPAEHCSAPGEFSENRAGVLTPDGCLERATYWPDLRLYLPGHDPNVPADTKHYGPGPHPSGSSQRVHAGRGRARVAYGRTRIVSDERGKKALQTVADLSEAELDVMFRLRGWQAEIDYRLENYSLTIGDAVLVHTTWRSGGRHMGHAWHKLWQDTAGRHAELTSFSLSEGAQADNIGREMLTRWRAHYKAAGYRDIRLFASGTVGRYAWAKLGFDYADPQRIHIVNRRFAQWARRQRLPEPCPTFTSATELAEYRAHMVSSDRIDNPAVTAGTRLPAGKAFMLDLLDDGHGEWEGYLEL